MVMRQRYFKYFIAFTSNTGRQLYTNKNKCIYKYWVSFFINPLATTIEVSNYI